MKLGASGENGSERLFCVRILCMNAYAPGYDRNTHPERMQEREERRMEERLSFRIVLSLVKNRRIQIAERSCDRMVASAAPRIPM